MFVDMNWLVQDESDKPTRLINVDQTCFKLINITINNLIKWFVSLLVDSGLLMMND